jgi:hypothetical protein
MNQENKEDKGFLQPTIVVSLPRRLIKAVLITAIVVMIVSVLCVVYFTYHLIRRDDKINKIQIDYLTTVIDGYKKESEKYYPDGMVGEPN